MRHEYNENDSIVSLRELVERKCDIDAIVPKETSLLQELSSGYIASKRTITEVHGLYGQSVCCICRNGQDNYVVKPGEQYDGIRIVVKTTFENVKDVEGKPYERNEEYIFRILDSDWGCCEIWGSFISEDDLSGFIDTELLDIYFTDTSLNTEYLNEIASYKSEHDYHNIQFVNFKTSKGTFQFTVYNCHNGYYGHDITVTKIVDYNAEIIYSKTI